MELIGTTLLMKAENWPKTNIELEGGYEFHLIVPTFCEFAIWVCPDLEIMTLNGNTLVQLNPSTRQKQ